MLFFNDELIPKYWFIIVFGIKLIAGIVLTMLYTNYYSDRSSTDIFKYFDDGKIMFDALKTNPSDYFKMLFAFQNDTLHFNTTYYDKMHFWYSEYPTNIFSDSHIIIRFNAFVQLFSFGHFHVHNVFINFISLIGLTAIFKTAIHHIRQSKKLLFYFIFLAPSVLFWGSGLLKESFIFFGIGMMFYSSVQLSKKWNIQNIVFFVLGFVVIIYTKMYILVAIIPALLGYLVNQKGIIKNVIIAFSFSFFMILLASYLLLNAPLKFNPFELIIAKQHDFLQLLTEVKSKSTFYVSELENYIDVLIQIPFALTNTFLRPFLWEVNSPLMLMSSLENLDIITLFLFSFYHKKNNPDWAKILFCISFVISLYVIIGLTVSNFGAIARYKVPAIPFLLLANVLLIDIEKLKQKIPILKKIL